MNKIGKRILAAAVASSVLVTPVFADPSVDDLKKSKESAQNEVSSLQTQLNTVVGKITELESQLSSKGEEIIQAQSDLEDAEAEEQKQYADMKVRIKYMYEAGDQSAVESLVGSEDFSDMVNKAEYVSNVHNYDRQKLQEYVETKQKISDLKDQLEESSLEVLDEGDKLEKVLLGLAYLKIIETFDRMAGKINEDEEDDKILRHKEIRRSDFIEYLKSHIGENNDSIIRSVQSIVMDVFFSVLANNPDMDVLQSQIFETIVNNTVKWMSELLADSTGQAAFYNSVSFESRERVMKFAGFTVRKREKAILMCFPGIQSFPQQNST